MIPTLPKTVVADAKREAAVVCSACSTTRTISITIARIVGLHLRLLLSQSIRQ